MTKNQMNPKIINCPEKKVIGMRSEMQRHQYNHIVSLWKGFMPRKKELHNLLTTELIAIQVYYDVLNAERPFTIWACAEVSDFNEIPTGMEAFTIPSGTYAVFHHKGQDASQLYPYIMREWLPNSAYHIDDRPHFQVMGDKYNNGSPDSEEDFYVPVKLK